MQSINHIHGSPARFWNESSSVVNESLVFTMYCLFSLCMQCICIACIQCMLYSPYILYIQCIAYSVVFTVYSIDTTMYYIVCAIRVNIVNNIKAVSSS